MEQSRAGCAGQAGFISMGMEVRVTVPGHFPARISERGAARADRTCSYHGGLVRHQALSPTRPSTMLALLLGLVHCLAPQVCRRAGRSIMR